MSITTIPARRARLVAVVALAAVALAVLLVGGAGGSGRRPPADGSTLQGRWVDPDGSGRLVPGPGEPLRDRTDLAPATKPGRVLATIGQLTDTHVRDEESPARVAFLDRLGGPFAPTFRLQETLTTQVMASGLQAMDDLDPDLVLVTGDIVDNAEQTELDQALAVLAGGRVDPDTGGPGYEGPQAADNPDPTFYRPDVDPPRHPGLLDTAQRAFAAPRLRAPWLPIPGNHDVLAAGEVTPTANTDAVATGDRMLTRPRADLQVPTDPAGASATVDALIAGGQLPGQTEHVTPDPRRRFVTPEQARTELRDAARRRDPSLLPDLGAPGLSTVRDLGARVRVITLDLDQRGEGAGGIVTPAHVAFLKRALAGAGSRWVLLVSHEPLRKATGGDEVLGVLDQDPRVLAVLAGDTHHHRIRARRSGAGGYWTIETSALADFPQQGRAIRIRETQGGGAVLETWAVDTAPGGREGGLATTARELAYLDAQGGRPQREAGTRLDRNVRLYKAAP